ncbi:MAG: monofunctional biosynthetic peptidoglycan transglycosylase [Spirochaetales bacterium]|nr:MAG: monofunctional biosynthetic peptidoglycan transglycosylase [Spirochaetales bacterium]
MKIQKPVLSIVRGSFAAAGAFNLLFFLFVLPFIILLSFCTPRVNMLMMYRALFYGEKSIPIKPAPLESLPGYLPGMFVLLEDHNFYRHPGIDPAAIAEAMERNKSRGQMTYGASTITQQLSRTIFLTPRKNYLRKYLEIFIALETDLILSKDRIMELYLNEIEWGKGVFGIRQASLYHYGKKPDALTKEEYMRLVSIITNPRDFNVKTLFRQSGMAARYAALNARFN